MDKEGILNEIKTIGKTAGRSMWPPALRPAIAIHGKGEGQLQEQDSGYRNIALTYCRGKGLFAFSPVARAQFVSLQCI